MDHDRGELDIVSMQALTFASAFEGAEIHAVLIGELGARCIGAIERCGAPSVHVVDHAALSDFAPEAWGDSLAQIAMHLDAGLILGFGSERGNEVLAHAAAALDGPFVANVVAVGGGVLWLPVPSCSCEPEPERAVFTATSWAFRNRTT